MARALSRAQTLENAAFLKALRRTGNIRLAARETGLSPATLHHRRARHPAFAHAWEAAIVVANARFHETGGSRAPKAAHDGVLRAHDGVLRTRGGEPVVVRRRDGKLQLRSAQPGKLTRQCEQAFLSALSATANIRMSAAAAQASVAAFYRRARRHAGFAREMRMALETGYARLEMALIASLDPGSHEDDAWRHNDPPPIPPMTANQALQLMYLHHKAVMGQAEPPHIKRRRGETHEAHSYRLSAMHEARMERDREAFRVAEALRDTPPGERHPHEPDPPPLPDLAQVTGWSRADPPKAAHDETRALFGGWRIEDLRGETGEGEE